MSEQEQTRLKNVKIHWSKNARTSKDTETFANIAVIDVSGAAPFGIVSLTRPGGSMELIPTDSFWKMEVDIV